MTKEYVLENIEYINKYMTSTQSEALFHILNRALILQETKLQEFCEHDYTEREIAGCLADVCDICGHISNEYNPYF